MGKNSNELVLIKPDKSNQRKSHGFLIFGSLIGVNISLMMLSGMYWLNPSFHLILGGKPM